jgi:hypothetical protein
MRIKFKKGVTPKDMASTFLRVLEERGSVIGSVNIYVQEYDDDMKPIPFDSDDFVTFEVVDKKNGHYHNYAAELRRKKIRVV